MKLPQMLLLGVLLAAAASAQTADKNSIGTLSGTVLDRSGASLAGAKVVLSKPSKKIKGTEVGQRTTADDGKFSFQVSPGFYNLVISKPKFKLAQVKMVEVVSDKVSIVRVGLLNENDAGQTEMTCDPPGPIQTTSTEVSHTYGNDCTGELMKGAPQPRDLNDLLRK